MYKRLKSAMDAKIEERNEVIGSSFLTDLKFTIAGDEYDVTKLLEVEGGTHQNVAESFAVKSEKILGLTEKLKPVTQENYNICKDLVTAYKVLKLSYDIEFLRVDMQTVGEESSFDIDNTDF